MRHQHFLHLPLTVAAQQVQAGMLVTIDREWQIVDTFTGQRLKSGAGLKALNIDLHRRASSAAEILTDQCCHCRCIGHWRLHKAVQI